MSLLLDCYLDDFGCPPAFTPPGPHTRVRVAHTALAELPRSARDFSSIIITGSAASVLDEEPWSLALEELIDDAYAHKVPLFGVCYGHQLIAKRLFGAAACADVPEIGWYDVRLNEAGQAAGSPIQSLPATFRCFLSHFDEVRDPGADNFEVLASSDACGVQAFRLTDAPIFGVQFHAEFSKEEALELFDIRTQKTPAAVPNAKAMRTRATDTLALWAPLYRAFHAAP